MSALGSLVVKLALDYAEYTQGLDRSGQDALKFAKNAQSSFDQAGNSAREFMGNVAGNVAGAIASVVGLNAAFTGIRDSINVLDSLDEAAQKTGSSIQDLSVIQKVAKNFNDAFEPIDQGLVKLSKNLADIKNPSSDAARALDAIGVSVRDNEGNIRSAAAVYIDAAKALQDYEDGSGKAAIATALFGKSGVELLPSINNLAQGIDDVKATSEEYTKQAALFNDQVAKGKARVNGLYESMAIELLPTLNTIAAAVNGTSSQFDILSAASAAARFVLKGLAIGGRAVYDTFVDVGRGIGGAAAVISAVLSGEFKMAGIIAESMSNDFIKSRVEFSKFTDTILNGEQQIASAVESGGTKKALEFQLNLPPAIDRTTQSLEKQAKVFDMELYKLRQYQDEAKRARDITASVATDQEKYNQTLEELDRLRPYLSIESYNRALEKAQGELNKTRDTGKAAMSDLDQYAVQAARNMQTSLANYLFDPFNDGLKGMVTGTLNAVRRMIAEFAALKIAQTLGLQQLFGGLAGAGSAGVSGATFSALGIGNILNAGSGLFSSFSGGVGSLLGRGASALGFTSFGAGASGAASAGAFGAGGLSFLSGPGTALGGLGGAAGAVSEFGVTAALGASMAAVAGPLIVADIVGRLFGGNKTLGGAEMIPVIGGFLAGLFGHGPLKFRQQSLQGDVSSAGFDGDITNVFRAKGGLLVGNKHKSVAQELSDDQQKTFDAAITGFYKSTHGFAENLGLSTDLVDNFTQQIQIKSEKGKQLTEEAITGMLSGIGDSLAKNVFPSVDEFRKVGESSAQTLSRLSGELTVLSNAAELLFGKSAAQSKAFINQFGFNDRTAFLDKAGGADAFSAMVSGFAQNFLTDDQRMRPVIESLVSQRDALGLGGINTRAQYVGAVQSGSLNQDQLLFLLKNQDAINQVFNYLDKFNSAVDDTAQSLAQATRELNIRSADETEYGQRLNKGIQDTTNAISELESVASRLNDTVNEINPLSVTQARRIVSSGNPDDPNLQAALSTLSNMGTDNFSSSLDYLRAKGANAAAVVGLQGVIGNRIAAKNKELAQFEFEKADFQANLARAGQMYASFPRYASGSSYIERTGPAIVHQGERIINPAQNSDLVEMLRQVVSKVGTSASETSGLTSLIKSLIQDTPDGRSLRMSAIT